MVCQLSEAMGMSPTAGRFWSVGNKKAVVLSGIGALSVCSEQESCLFVRNTRLV